MTAECSEPIENGSKSPFAVIMGMYRIRDIGTLNKAVIVGDR